MEIDLPAEDDPRRLEVREWFAQNPKPTPRQLVDAGYVVPHWPLPYGLDADPELQLIIDDEMRRAGVSRPVNPIGIGHCGPILVSPASDEQRTRTSGRCSPATTCGASFSGLRRLTANRAREQSATAMSTSSTARRSGHRSPSAKYGILIAVPTERCQARRHLVLHHPMTSKASYG
jgi:hypothetical protein